MALFRDVGRRRQSANDFDRCNGHRIAPRLSPVQGRPDVPGCSHSDSCACPQDVITREVISITSGTHISSAPRNSHRDCQRRAGGRNEAARTDPEICWIRRIPDTFRSSPTVGLHHREAVFFSVAPQGERRPGWSHFPSSHIQHCIGEPHALGGCYHR